MLTGWTLLLFFLVNGERWYAGIGAESVCPDFFSRVLYDVWW